MTIRRVVLGLILATSLAAQEAKKVVHEGVTYQVVTAAPKQVRILWKGAQGRPLEHLPLMKRELARRGEKPLVIMNGGIFGSKDGQLFPLGLLIQDRKLLRPVNRGDEEGNFYLKPNGVFLIAGEQAQVIDTADYPTKGPAIDFAVQSGPLLLKGGVTHPVFKKHSKFRLHRNGVGIGKDGQVIFAITDFYSPKFPTLWDFAAFFRHPGCADALFLDGDISELRAGDEIDASRKRWASMIAVVEDATRSVE